MTGPAADIPMRRIGSQCDTLGECPTWDARASKLRWIDVTGKRLSTLDPGRSPVEDRRFEDYPGSITMRQAGGILVAFRRSLALLDDDGTEAAKIVPPSIDFTRERFNDGKCDRHGRFWVGTMDRRLKQPLGALYRVDPDLSVHRMSEGYGISNGLAWSPDDRILYHCDSSPTVIYAYDFDGPSGTIANRRVFVEFTAGMGRPDGCATDADGFLWVASPGAGCVRCFAPDGRQTRMIETPVRFPSSVAFGGNGLRTLFITTLKPHELTPEGRASELDGALYATEPGVVGMPVGVFLG